MIEVTIAVPTHTDLIEQFTVEVSDEFLEDPEIYEGNLTPIVGGQPGDIDGVVQLFVVDRGGSLAKPSQFAEDFVTKVEGQIMEWQMKGEENSEDQIFESVDQVDK